MIKTKGIATREYPYLTQATDQNQKSVIINSSRKPNEYMSPSQMLEVALAGCLTMTTKGVLFTRGLPYEDVQVTCIMNRKEKETSFNISIEIIADLDEEIKKEIAQEAYNKCYVRNILTQPIFTTLD